MTAPLIHIVDDDEHVRHSTSFLLRSRGYATALYSDGRALLDQAWIAPGCILLDLRMPGMSGLEVLHALAARGIDLPVIILSGHGDLRAAVQAIKLGATEFIEKPYAERDLLDAIDRAGLSATSSYLQVCQDTEPTVLSA